MEAPFKLGDRVRYGEAVGTVDSVDPLNNGADWAIGVRWDSPRQHEGGSLWDGEVLYASELARLSDVASSDELTG